jgi:hypothetical protein
MERAGPWRPSCTTGARSQRHEALQLYRQSERRQVTEASTLRLRCQPTQVLTETPGFVMACTNSNASRLVERTCDATKRNGIINNCNHQLPIASGDRPTVSVRPCKNPRVEFDSYVATRLPFNVYCASWSAICTQNPKEKTIEERQTRGKLLTRNSLFTCAKASGLVLCCFKRAPPKSVNARTLVLKLSNNAWRCFAASSNAAFCALPRLNSYNFHYEPTCDQGRGANPGGRTTTTTYRGSARARLGAFAAIRCIGEFTLLGVLGCVRKKPQCRGAVSGSVLQVCASHSILEHDQLVLVKPARTRLSQQQ